MSISMMTEVSASLMGFPGLRGLWDVPVPWRRCPHWAKDPPADQVVPSRRRFFGLAEHPVEAEKTGDPIWKRWGPRQDGPTGPPGPVWRCMLGLTFRAETYRRYLMGQRYATARTTRAPNMQPEGILVQRQTSRRTCRIPHPVIIPRCFSSHRMAFTANDTAGPFRLWSRLRDGCPTSRRELSCDW